MPVPRTAAALAVALLAALATASAAPAKNRDVDVRGTCTGRSTVELEVGLDDGRLEIELEVDQNRNGVRWHVQIRRNGKLVVNRTAVTRAPSGSFEVERKISNAPGKDRIVATATSPSGERCRAALVF